ncbi:hypothetical protein EV137_4329 [Kribbella pratensis]|uniref:Restriction endonuclease subunit S n=1 Tax=Kribbella pratensis TaxID=2512112 RepID=A0ABY2FGM3_9ACTN|nr:restriction endonuclease subunit S [Kribbella pratensis]TDW90511.1 hypothetical protein EV137_4329 [Kribbella pratensis]
MKIAGVDNPVRVDWFYDQGFRLDAKPYLSGSLAARKRIESLPGTVTLGSVTAGHGGGIFKGPMFRRVYLTDPAHSVPFLGSKDMMAADLTNLPRLRKSDAVSRNLAYLRLKPGMTLISRSGFYAGRRSYVRPDMGDVWASDDVLRVEPSPERIRSGYLYAFLVSRFGEALVRGTVYGSAVKHIEPHHLTGLPVPRFADALEERVHQLVEESARLRAAFQSGLERATEDLFRSVGLPELVNYRWHQESPDLGFEVADFGVQSIRALNFAPRARRIVGKLSSVEHRTLGEICEGGLLSRGVRFKRVDSEAEFGAKLVGQRQAFWIRPEGRMLASGSLPAEVFADDETIMVASQGTLGEQEVFCRAFLATGSWLGNAYSEHFLRIKSGDEGVSGAYLFAFLRSEIAFRVFRSMSAGGKQQDIHEGLRRKVPVPLASPADRERIAETVRQAYRDRDQADLLEDEALVLLTAAVEGAES